jgi:hypothetical protein
VTQVVLLRHPERGVLLLHSTNRRWHLPDVTLTADDEWDRALLRGVGSSTGITDLRIDGVLMVDTFAPGLVGDEPHYGVFFACSTTIDRVTPGPPEDDHRWVAAPSDLDDLRSDLFHPLIEQLVMYRLNDAGPWPVQPGAEV